MITRIATTALLAAALLVPAGVATAEKGGKGKGKTRSEQKAKGKSKAKNAVFSGTVVSFDAAANTVTMTVTKANSWGRRFKGQDVTFDVSKVSKLGVTDTNADGKTDINDVKPGDKAHAQAKILKTAVSPLVARKFKVQYPEAEQAPAPAPAP